MKIRQIVRARIENTPIFFFKINESIAVDKVKHDGVNDDRKLMELTDGVAA